MAVVAAVERVFLPTMNTACVIEEISLQPGLVTSSDKYHFCTKLHGQTTCSPYAIAESFAARKRSRQSASLADKYHEDCLERFALRNSPL